MTNPINDYVRDIMRHGDGEATEFTHRLPLETLLNALAKPIERADGNIKILHEPSRLPGIGAPDFILLNNGGANIGCVECKKPQDNLNTLIGGRQLEKYRALSPNILLTDYWRFLLLKDGAVIKHTTLSVTPTVAEKEQLQELLNHFLITDAQSIGDAKTLADSLAVRCAALRCMLKKEILKEETSALHGLYDSFCAAIYDELDREKFADVLSQTLIYALLMSKLKAPGDAKIDLYTAEQYIPGNFALIREIAGFLKQLQADAYHNIRYLLDNVLSAINAIDAHALAESMRYKNIGADEDPYLNFYENFLAAYDPDLREKRGVYYTPLPVARFIVRAADDILRRDFKLKDGLGDKNVTALDFATGTGTFMLEMFRCVLNDKTPTKRAVVAHSHLLQNFFGFELLIAPYIIAHLKLSYFLQDMGVELNRDERIQVFLTNALEQHETQFNMSFLPAMSEEANRAQEIKEKNILVITGNPPYSGVSQNRGKWITDLIEDYKYVNGTPLKEQNLKVLQDDYVKFMRFAQHKMNGVEKGVVAIITNHSFLDNPTFRGMRRSLMTTFNRMYFLDLHGNTKKRECAPDGGKDENIFDIQQGVAVSILIKNPKIKKGVYHADVFGQRKEKYRACLSTDMQDVKWKEIKPEATSHFAFIPFNFKQYAQYEKHWQIKDIFTDNGTGIVSHRDDFAFAFDKTVIQKRMRDMANASMSDAEFWRRHPTAKETRDWKLSIARDMSRQEKNINKRIYQCAYRPFDFRQCFYGNETMDNPRIGIMRHMLTGDNIALVSVRQVAESVFNHVFITDTIADFRMTLSNRGGAFVFPLYVYAADMNGGSRRENISPEFRQWINSHYGKKHSPENIMGYIYAVLHSPDYRRRYAEFLRMDFPRIPFCQDNAEFLRLAKIGNKLISAHLLRKIPAGKTQLQGTGKTHIVEQVKYDDNNRRLYYNADEYFAPILPTTINFQIGGYKPLLQFLKSRKNRTLTATEMETLEQAANAIADTVRQMEIIDKKK